MNHSIIDFNKISRALTDTIEAVKDDNNFSNTALEQLENAQNELQQALSFSLSSKHK
ncbi:hypothetical protein BGM26_08605 [Bacillus sp. FJAT-29790]|uniref:hypothetical protein n=1 Tax=Bacillus sp. FJAT-29790 TaxID=1895002 RepID=UPI001C214F6F|nr:hypothetical protein [Bacillus sp. FJAT-29790]MBU8879045.1 hypothetical protein [Bacillus sp. FJAT-29790]